MTISAQQISQGSLRLPSGAPGARRDPEALRALLGTKQIPARLALLPEPPPRWKSVGTSLIAQITLAVIVVSIPLLYPEKLVPKMMYEVIQLETPPTDVPLPPKPEAPKRPVARKKPAPPPVEKPAPEPEVAKFFAPKLMAPPKAKPKIQTAADLPKVDETFQPVKVEVPVDNRQPAKPREPVKTGMMSSGSAAPATITKPIPVEKVQTGGFGDPHGDAGPANERGRVNVNALGSPALPPGPGYGNGTGGAKGVRGTVASAGFGNGTAIPPASNNRNRGTVQSGGFANENAGVIEAPKKKASDSGPVVEPVVILAKPKPEYSQEAIKLGLEGDVLLDVVFPASGGEVQVNRVIKGLGHGLDEAAVRAAKLIKYRPAMSGGHAVDFPAVVHIVFQIAN